MKSYVWLTFAFLGWGYYEVSGGADFEPQRNDVAMTAMQEADAPEVVTRADTTTLLSVSTSNIEPAPEQADEAAIQLAVAQAVAIDNAQLPEVVEPAAPIVETAAVEPKLDLREVAGSRVNMRMGPGTDFDVITTLDGGTKLEVLEITEDGWANVSTVDRGVEGWMAERLLTSPEA